MRTPREILLQRHECANDRLDDTRKNALAAAFPQTPSVEPSQSMKGTLWHQFSALFQFKAQTGFALAAVWVVIFALKLATHDETHVATVKSPVSQAVMAEVRLQKRFFTELAGLHEVRDADRPKSSPPRPRSERYSENMMA